MVLKALLSLLTCIPNNTLIMRASSSLQFIDGPGQHMHICTCTKTKIINDNETKSDDMWNNPAICSSCSCNYFLLLLSYRPTLDKYSSELNQIVHSLLTIIAKNLGLEPDVLTEKCQDGVQSVRINYYPPCLQYDKVRHY